MRWVWLMRERGDQRAEAGEIAGAKLESATTPPRLERYIADIPAAYAQAGWASSR